MHIKRLYIYGFGKWSNKEVLFTKGLNCVYGENEAGKSTIHQAIIYILFGLSPKLRQQYKPKVFSNMGGQLVIKRPDGSNITIERQEGMANGSAICYLDNGEQRDESWLKNQLNGMTSETYKKIFSYSELDVEHGEGFKEVDLGKMILNIGLTGATDIQVFERKLETNLGDIFKRSGRKPALNMLLNNMEELQKKINTDEQELARYAEIVNKIESTELLLDILIKDQEQLKTDERIIEKKLQALSLLLIFRQYEELLRSLPDCVYFPEKGRERLERLNDMILPIESEIGVLMNELTIQRERYQNINESLYTEEERDRLEKLIDKLPDYEDLHKDKINLIARISNVQQRITNQLQQLNIDLINEELDHISFTFYTQNEWNEVKQQHEIITQQKSQLHEKQKQIAKEKEFHQNQLTQKEKEQIALNKARLYDIESDNKENKNQTMPRIMLLSMIAIIIVFIIGLVTKEVIYLFASGLVAIITIFVLYNQLRVGKLANRANNEKISQPANILENAILECKNALKQLNIAEIQYEEGLYSVELEEKRLNERKTDLFVRYPFLQQVNYSYWNDLYHLLKQILELKEEENELHDALIDKETKMAIYESELRTMIKCYDEDKASSSVTECINWLKFQYETNKSSFDNLLRLKESCENHVDRVEILNKKLQPYQREKESLLNQANARNETEFYETERNVMDKKAILNDKKQLTDQLDQLLERAVWLQLLEGNLREDKLEEQLTDTHENIKKLDAKLLETQQQKADLAAECRKLESYETISTNRYNLENEKTILNKKAKQWATLKFAKEMLIETKRLYEQKHLTAVIDETKIHFNEITDGRYIAIYPPTDKLTLQVEDKSGIRYKVNELSTSTINQLYISLRLAISEKVAKDNELPFILDDPLVHFDQRRTKNMLNILESIASTKQIILFTCKQEITNELKSTDVISLTKDTI